MYSIVITNTDGDAMQISHCLSVFLIVLGSDGVFGSCVSCGRGVVRL